MGARDFDGVFVGIRPAQGEQDFGQPAAGVMSANRFRGQRADFGRHARRGIRQFGRLLLDGADDALVAVTDVDAHGHRVEIEVAFVVHIPEIDAFGAFDRDGVDFGLGRPGVKSVFTADAAKFGHRAGRTWQEF
jgi:hypothetical protein